MKKKIILIFLLIFLVFGFYKVKIALDDNRKLIENTQKIKIGQNPIKVREIMGEPIDIFPMEFSDDRGDFEVYLYDAPILGSGGVEVWFKDGLVDHVYDGIK